MSSYLGRQPRRSRRSRMDRHALCLEYQNQNSQINGGGDLSGYLGRSRYSILLGAASAPEDFDFGYQLVHEYDLKSPLCYNHQTAIGLRQSRSNGTFNITSARADKSARSSYDTGSVLLIVY